MNSTGKCSSTPHGRLSQLVDIGPFGPAIARLDAGLESCLSAVQGLLIHTDVNPGAILDHGNGRFVWPSRSKIPPF